MRGTLILVVFVLGGSACGGPTGRASDASDTTRSEAHAAPQNDLCPGWVRHEAPGGTSFALPGRGRREQQGTATAFTHDETEVYFQLIERMYEGLDGGSDAAAVDGILAGLGDPATAQLDDGWRIVEQRRTEFQGRPAAERVIDIAAQVQRRELHLRAGNTMVSIITMARGDRGESTAEAMRCFNSALRFAAPPSG